MCRAPFVWNIKLWWDEDAMATGLESGRCVRLVRCCGDTNVMTVASVEGTGCDQRVNFKSEVFELSTPTNIIVRLGPALYGDLSITNACYVARLVQACVDPRECKKLLQAFR